jgi:hypothetical protein
MRTGEARYGINLPTAEGKENNASDIQFRNMAILFSMADPLWG